MSRKHERSDDVNRQYLASIGGMRGIDRLFARRRQHQQITNKHGRVANLVVSGSMAQRSGVIKQRMA